MNLLGAEMPERFFDVGIAEEHAVTFSAGLAAGGMLPFCNIYSSFAQRAYDQVIHDVALQGLDVVLCLDRAGLVGEAGATHHGAFDLSAFRSVPGAVICAPRDETELKNLMYTATLRKGSPFIIRYPRGWGEGRPWRGEPFREIAPGTAEKLLDGNSLTAAVATAAIGEESSTASGAKEARVAILALGPFANRAVQAARNHAARTGVCPDVWDVRFLRPFDPTILSAGYEVIVTVEDGVLKGGLFSEVVERVDLMRTGASESSVAAAATAPTVIPVGIPDVFIHQGTQQEQRQECRLTAEGIESVLQQAYAMLP